jgi:hypothetical protein
MMMPFLQVAPLAAERVINAMPGGVLIAMLAWVLLRSVRRQNSGTRFAVWFCALLAVAGLPFVELAGKVAPGTHAVRSEIVLPGTWAVGIFAVWMLIVAVATLRIVVGLWKVRRLRSGAVPLESSDFSRATTSPLIQTLSIQTPVFQNAGIQEVVGQFQNTRRVEVCRSSAVTVPTAIGFFRPVILIPDWVLRDLSAEELKVILLHEFTHLRRWDDWTNLAQKLVRTIFFFHPAVWWIERRLSLEREMACDEAVLAETENPRAYAECLVSLAEKSFVRRGVALAQAVVGRARETSLRLARILDGNRPRSPRVFRPAFGLVAALAVGCAIALPDAPRLITFESAGPAPVINLASAANTSLLMPNAAVIPAALRTSEVLVRAAAIRKSATTEKLHRKARASEVAVARQKEVTAPAPSSVASVTPVAESQNLYHRGHGGHGGMIVNARGMMVDASIHEEIAAPLFQLVMQMTQYDEGGAPVLSFSVWRVTFEGGNRQMVRQEVIVRSL